MVVEQEVARRTVKLVPQQIAARSDAILNGFAWYLNR